MHVTVKRFSTVIVMVKTVISEVQFSGSKLGGKVIGYERIKLMKRDVKLLLLNSFCMNDY
jgi:hypothetical protein